MSSVLSMNGGRWGLAAAASLGAILFVAWYFRPPTLEQVALRGLEAVGTRDSGLLLGNLTRSEVEMLKLTDDKLRRFLNTFVGPRMQGFQAIAKPRIEPSPETGQLIVYQEYVHSDGRKIVLDMIAAATPEGPKLTSAIASTTFSMLGAKLRPGEAYPRGRAKFAFLGAAIREASPQLSSTGVTGFVRQGTKSGKDEYFTFDQFAERCERLGNGEPATNVAGASR